MVALLCTGEKITTLSVLTTQYRHKEFRTNNTNIVILLDITQLVLVSRESHLKPTQTDPLNQIQIYNPNNNGNINVFIFGRNNGKLKSPKMHVNFNTTSSFSPLFVYILVTSTCCCIPIYNYQTSIKLTCNNVVRKQNNHRCSCNRKQERK